MIERKKIRAYGSTSGQIVFPKALIGTRVWVLSEGDAEGLKELVERTLLYRRIDLLERKEFSRRFDVFEREVLARVTALENALLGTSQKRDPLPVE